MKLVLLISVVICKACVSVIVSVVIELCGGHERCEFAIACVWGARGIGCIVSDIVVLCLLCGC